jgi:hypothetical protein
MRPSHLVTRERNLFWYSATDEVRRSWISSPRVLPRRGGSNLWFTSLTNSSQVGVPLFVQPPQTTGWHRRSCRRRPRRPCRCPGFVGCGRTDRTDSATEVERRCHHRWETTACGRAWPPTRRGHSLTERHCRRRPWQTGADLW